MIDKNYIGEIISEYIGQNDIFIVEIAVNSANNVSVIVDKPEGITINECGLINRMITEKLEKEKGNEDYELMVSSPGLGTPLKVLQQYMKNIGNTVEVVKKDGMKITGVLSVAAENYIVVEIIRKEKKEGMKRPENIVEQMTIQMNDIKSTKILVSF